MSRLISDFHILEARGGGEGAHHKAMRALPLLFICGKCSMKNKNPVMSMCYVYVSKTQYLFI